MAQSIVVLFLLASFVGALVHGAHGSDEHPPTTVLAYTSLRGLPYSVTYDDRSFLLNGSRTLFLSGSIHYPRSTPEMWDTLFNRARQNTLNMIETYVFWNLHERVPGTFNFTVEGGNLIAFLTKAAEHGFFVNLRIGPYVCAEWNYGGLPIWLNDVAGLVPRSSERMWEYFMARFVGATAAAIEPFLAKNGGPIVLTQIENEYHNEKYQDYVDWCGDLANGLNLEIPVLMCSGMSAINTINACNGNDCANFANSHTKQFPGQPLVWTENEGWFQIWGQGFNRTVGIWEAGPGSPPSRTPANVAFTVLRWIARGGCVHNYYMWHGGNHYGAWYGDSVSTMYADDNPLHADGLPNEPKYSHLGRLHKSVVDVASVLLQYPNQVDHPISLQWFDPVQKKFVPGTQQRAFSYGPRITFIESEAPVPVLTQWNSTLSFAMSPMSCILVDLQTGAIMFNSSDVHGTDQAVTAATPLNDVSPKRSDKPTVRAFHHLTQAEVGWTWQGAWSEPIPVPESVPPFAPDIVADHPLEQLNITHDVSEYLYYDCTVTLSADPRGTAADLNSVVESVVNGAIAAQTHTLKIDGSSANAYLVFLNEEYFGTAFDRTHGSYTGRTNLTIPVTITLPPGSIVRLTILSVSLGLVNFPIGPDYPLAAKGIRGSVFWDADDLTHNLWRHRAALSGELLRLNLQDDVVMKSPWSANIPQFIARPVTWWRVLFRTPNPATLLATSLKLHSAHKLMSGRLSDRTPRIPATGSGRSSFESVEFDLYEFSLWLNMTGASSGRIYINAFEIGRHWPEARASDEFAPTQDSYHVPWNILRPESEMNVLIFFDELGLSTLGDLHFMIGSMVPVPS